MEFFNRLFGRRPDPTRNWGANPNPIPDYDWRRMRFGVLEFGDPLEAAEPLGRPDRFQWTLPDYCVLLYASGGFQMDFDNGRLAYLAFFIGPDEHSPRPGYFQFSQPRIIGGRPDGLRLSEQYGRNMLERVLGPPQSEDRAPDETVMFYTFRGITMEFEIQTATDRLKRWNLYPKNS